MGQVTMPTSLLARTARLTRWRPDHWAALEQNPQPRGVEGVQERSRRLVGVVQPALFLKHSTELTRLLDDPRIRLVPGGRRGRSARFLAAERSHRK